jgi:uncharacterized protein YecT (DUF1311 family)
MNKYLGVMAVAVLANAQPAIAASCEKPNSSREVAECLGSELRESDGRINRSYQTVMKLLGEGEQKVLRAEQRSWMRERDMVCNLDTREKDRERWYRGILTDYSKTVCVTRYTRVRTMELEALLGRKTQDQQGRVVSVVVPKPVSQPRPDLFPKNAQAYSFTSVQTREKGRWYWEVSVSIDEIANLHPTALWMGCGNREEGIGELLNIRANQSGYGVRTVGVALDLQDGKLYLRRDANWEHGTPGSAKGSDLKLGRAYRCGVNSTIAVTPLQQLNFLDVNFGGKPFKHPIPDGYSPFAP